MYSNGQGTPINYVKAYAHLSIAKALDYSLAIGNLNNTARRMTSSQISEAQSLVEKMWNELPENK